MDERARNPYRERRERRSDVGMMGMTAGGPYPRSIDERTPNERALDSQHGLIAALEGVARIYRERGDAASKPAQQVARLLGLERERLRMLRLRVQRERARPGG